MHIKASLSTRRFTYGLFLMQPEGDPGMTLYALPICGITSFRDVLVNGVSYFGVAIDIRLFLSLAGNWKWGRGIENGVASKHLTFHQCVMDFSTQVIAVVEKPKKGQNGANGMSILTFAARR